MKINQLSSCFCTKDVSACRDFYQKYLGAKITFDCGWYLNMDIGTQGASIQFMFIQIENHLKNSNNTSKDSKVLHFYR